MTKNKISATYDDENEHTSTEFGKYIGDSHFFFLYRNYGGLLEPA